jgi:copper chaperone
MKSQLSVKGMTCNGCVNSVRKRLERLPGVESVAVSLEEKSAEVEHDEAQVKAEDLAAAVNGIGYEAAVKS